VISLGHTAASKEAIAAAASLAFPTFGISNEKGRSFRGGRMRSRQIAKCGYVISLGKVDRLPGESFRLASKERR
jgi:hypothetical protein